MAARRPHPTSVSRSTFADLGVPSTLTAALAAAGVTEPFPIQAATLPDTLAGRDVLGRGRTGSGKTYAFAIPLLARLAASTTARRPGRPRALILVPTRELATQIAAVLEPLAKVLRLRTLTVFGGTSPGPQRSALRSGVDVLVACPGRLADHVETGHAILDAVEITVLDEADHMADLGFLPVVRRLLERTPRHGQRLLFSATLDAGVDVLVRRFLTDPVVHNVDPPAAAQAPMDHHVLHVRAEDRLAILVDLAAAPGRTMVFTRTKHGAKALTRRLVAAGIAAVELHGNLAQSARTRNLAAFADGAAGTLVATDIAARGIHVDDVALVIHADPPVEHKAYLHRSGRTGRAGAAGTVVTLMTDGQVGDVRQLTRKAGINPTTTRLRPGDELLTRLAPGERSLVSPPQQSTAVRSNGTRQSTPARSNGARQSTPARSNGAQQPRQRATAAAGGQRSATSGGQRAAASGGQRSAGAGGQRTGASGGQRVAASGGQRTAASGGQRPPTSGGRGQAAFSARSRVGSRRAP